MASYFPMVKNAAQRIVFPILDADGDPVSGAADLDSERSLDGGAFADCAAEATEIGSSGIYYLDLAVGETDGDVVCIQVKTSTSGAKTTVLVFYTAAQTLDETDAVVDSILADTAAIDGHITADYGAAQKGALDDLIDGGRLDLLIDAIITYETTIPGLLATIQTDLDNPDQYKANVAALALEATLTAIKGAAWTNETLKLIKELVDELETGEKPPPKAHFRI